MDFKKYLEDYAKSYINEHVQKMLQKWHVSKKEYEKYTVKEYMNSTTIEWSAFDNNSEKLT